jgi:hypothetical protein
MKELNTILVTGGLSLLFTAMILWLGFLMVMPIMVLGLVPLAVLKEIESQDYYFMFLLLIFYVVFLGVFTTMSSGILVFILVIIYYLYYVNFLLNRK